MSGDDPDGGYERFWLALADSIAEASSVLIEALCSLLPPP